MKNINKSDLFIEALEQYPFWREVKENYKFTLKYQGNGEFDRKYKRKMSHLKEFVESQFDSIASFINWLQDKTIDPLDRTKVFQNFQKSIIEIQTAKGRDGIKASSNSSAFTFDVVGLLNKTIIINSKSLKKSIKGTNREELPPDLQIAIYRLHNELKGIVQWIFKIQAFQGMNGMDIIENIIPNRDKFKNFKFESDFCYLTVPREKTKEKDAMVDYVFPQKWVAELKGLLIKYDKKTKEYVVNDNYPSVSHTISDDYRNAIERLKLKNQWNEKWEVNQNVLRQYVFTKFNDIVAISKTYWTKKSLTDNEDYSKYILTLDDLERFSQHKQGILQIHYLKEYLERIAKNFSLILGEVGIQEPIEIIQTNSDLTKQLKTQLIQSEDLTTLKKEMHIKDQEIAELQAKQLEYQSETGELKQENIALKRNQKRMEHDFKRLEQIVITQNKGLIQTEGDPFADQGIEEEEPTELTPEEEREEREAIEEEAKLHSNHKPHPKDDWNPDNE